MKVNRENLDKLKESFEKKDKEVRPDDSRVIIAEMQINAIKELATDTNQVFSQLSSLEVFDVSRAYVFADNPLPAISNRLKEKGIDCKFQLPILTNFLDSNIKHRHKIDRKRVEEYIESLKAVAPKQSNMFMDDKPRTGILGRMI